MKAFCFSLCGFKDALTFGFVDETKIKNVENFIQNKLPGIISKWKTREDKPPINDENFFGDIHVFAPNLFEFTEGDRIQIASIAAYVNKIVNDEALGIQYFAANTFQSAKPNYKRVGQYFGKEPSYCGSKPNTKTGDIKLQLYTNALKILKKKGVKTSQFTENMVSVKESDHGNPVGFVECVLCKPFNEQREPQAVQSKVIGEPLKVYWIMSNFGKHVGRHLKKKKSTTMTVL